jgi:hypothetical protein
VIIVINVHTYSRKVPVILVRHYLNLNFLNRFSSDMKFHENYFIVSRGFECGRTDRHEEDNSRFRNFVKATKIELNDIKQKEVKSECSYCIF